MNSKTISKIQVIIAIAAVVYVIAPDLLIGPIDDTAVIALATIADVILGVTKSRISEATTIDHEYEF